MDAGASYFERREQLRVYFDRTAAQSWARLTSDAPVSGIRAAVRNGRNEMRRTLLDWLPADLDGTRVLDAGCGTGALACDLARRGATVHAVELAPTLLEVAAERVPADLAARAPIFRVGDMLDPALGSFDYVLAMDSLIHYDADDLLDAIARLAERTRYAVLLTFAPRTVPLVLLHACGRRFPRADRAPAIAPIAERALRARLDGEPRFVGWRVGRTRRVTTGFYTSQALELVRR